MALNNAGKQCLMQKTAFEGLCQPQAEGSNRGVLEILCRQYSSSSEAYPKSDQNGLQLVMPQQCTQRVGHLEHWQQLIDILL